MPPSTSLHVEPPAVLGRVVGLKPRGGFRPRRKGPSNLTLVGPAAHRRIHAAGLPGMRIRTGAISSQSGNALGIGCLLVVLLSVVVGFATIVKWLGQAFR